jgi:trimethylamine--corrinoid protein Co-methyltransferase
LNGTSAASPTKARARKEVILATPSAARFNPMLDAEIRRAFKIHLPM